jgi:sterol desaturase/sphingolipid hydroxylase (fatty acid hydroxylase superfamily)
VGAFSIRSCCLLTKRSDVFYDCTHYALHHTKLPAYLREVKKYHLAHHYKNYELGFGVTSTSPTHTLVTKLTS